MMSREEGLTEPQGPRGDWNTVLQGLEAGDSGGGDKYVGVHLCKLSRMGKFIRTKSRLDGARG